MKNYLNLGCGTRFHPAWTNIDFTQTDSSIIAIDIMEGIPFPDASFDMVYHSHLLEHLPKANAPAFLKECYRVLHPKGILRVVVPDLETIARHYLLSLEKAKTSSQEGSNNYDWMLLEMYDQTVRNFSGGEMAAYLRKSNIPNEQFIIERCGVEVKRLIESARQQKLHNAADISSAQQHSWLKKFGRLFYDGKHRREMLFKLILKNEYDALQLGRFRLSGEVHQWMYDCFSLGRLLKECGFIEIVSRTAIESYIADWSQFNLDNEPDGSVYKPDSLYMEAIKP